MCSYDPQPQPSVLSSLYVLCVCGSTGSLSQDMQDTQEALGVTQHLVWTSDFRDSEIPV